MVEKRIPQEAVGRLIGSKGATLALLREETGASLKVETEEDSEEATVLIEGDERQTAAAIARIDRIVNGSKGKGKSKGKAKYGPASYGLDGFGKFGKGSEGKGGEGAEFPMAYAKPKVYSKRTYRPPPDVVKGKFVEVKKHSSMSCAVITGPSKAWRDAVLVSGIKGLDLKAHVAKDYDGDAAIFAAWPKTDTWDGEAVLNFFEKDGVLVGAAPLPPPPDTDDEEDLREVEDDDDDGIQ
jgi:rRNA processing protein Krr1/Pno1